jgi:hypothetical protein
MMLRRVRGDALAAAANEAEAGARKTEAGGASRLMRCNLK